MKRGEMLTGRSVSADCGLRIAACGFQAAIRRFQLGRVVLAAGLLCGLIGLAVFRFGSGVNAAVLLGLAGRANRRMEFGNELELWRGSASDLSLSFRSYAPAKMFDN